MVKLYSVLIHWFDLVWFKFIAQNLKEEELKGLKTMFANMDTDKSGTITYEELKSGLEKLGSKLTETEVKQLLEDVRLICSSY